MRGGAAIDRIMRTCVATGKVLATHRPEGPTT